MSKTEETKALITKSVQDVNQLQELLKKTEIELMQVEAFKDFIAMQKQFQEKSTQVWDLIEELMIANDIKTVKADWGSLTIGERIGFDIDHEELPSKYYKKVPDTKRIADTYKLTNKPIKGASVKYTRYLLRRLK